MALYINQDIVVINNEIEQNTFIFDRRNRIKSIINDDMFEVLEYIYNHIGITKEKLLEYYIGIDDVIEQLVENNILKNKKQKRCNNIKHINNLDTARLFVELTDKCNLRCKHCYGDFKLENGNSLDINKLDNLINQAIELNVYQFDLTGGEPLLYVDLEILLSKLYDAGMLVTIFSNLVIQSEKILKLFDKYCVKKIITSIDSCVNKSHDDFRGVDGALKRTVGNVRKLKKTGIELAVNTMVGNHNYDNIEDTISFLKELDIPCVLDAIIPNGRANKLDEKTFKSVQVIHDLYKREDLNVQLKITDCGVGKRFLYIKSNGNVCLCPSLVTNKFVFGNINKADFNLKSCFIDMIEKYGDLRCKKECSKKDICNGGCRARALIFQDGLYNKDLNSCILCGELCADEIK